MSNMNPFEIRLEILKMAKDLLTEDYHANREKVTNEWNVKVDFAKINGEPVPNHPGLPAYPTEKEILTKAQDLNGFVSNTSTETKPTITKRTEKATTQNAA